MSWSLLWAGLCFAFPLLPCSAGFLEPAAMPLPLCPSSLPGRLSTILEAQGAAQMGSEAEWSQMYLLMHSWVCSRCEHQGSAYGSSGCETAEILMIMLMSSLHRLAQRFGSLTLNTCVKHAFKYFWRRLTCCFLLSLARPEGAAGLSLLSLKRNLNSGVSTCALCTSQLRKWGEEDASFLL